jgi:hypothetical protein
MASGGSDDGRRHLEENPFFVLGLAADAPRVLVEREGQKLIAMLEVGLGAAAEYLTPLGPRRRTPELVRWALAELRQPERRLLYELWAAAPLPTAPAGGGPLPEERQGWPKARVVYGWKAR